MGGGHSLVRAGLLFPHGDLWGLGGKEHHGGAGAHEVEGRQRGCVRTGGRERERGPGDLGRLEREQEADARKAVEEVWFWDKSLKREDTRHTACLNEKPPFINFQSMMTG